MTPEAERADSDYLGWRVDARCRTADPQLFFPESNIVANQQNRYAKGYCLECTVSTECLVYGRHEPYGIWGGFTYNERRRTKKAIVDARIAAWRMAKYSKPTQALKVVSVNGHTIDDYLRPPPNPRFTSESSWRDDL